MPIVKDLPRPDVGENITYLVLSDLHSFHMDRNLFLKSLKMLNNCTGRKKVILLGDILDCEYLHSKDKFFLKVMKDKAFEDMLLPEVDKEIIWFEMLLEKISEVVGYENIIYIEGNHEERLRRDWIKEVPLCLVHNFDLFKRMDFEKRKIPFIIYNDFFRLTSSNSPDFLLTHGIYCNMTHLKKHVESTRASIMYGHTHQRWIGTFPGIKTITGYNCPTLADTNPKYMNNRINNWVKGIAFIQQTRKYTTANILEEVSGKFVDLYGKEY